MTLPLKRLNLLWRSQEQCSAALSNFRKIEVKLLKILSECLKMSIHLWCFAPQHGPFYRPAQPNRHNLCGLLLGSLFEDLFLFVMLVAVATLADYHYPSCGIGSRRDISSALGPYMACQRSQSCWSPSQKSAGIPRTRARRKAVSGVTARRPRTISFSRG